jgi:hypothetical protein
MMIEARRNPAERRLDRLAAFLAEPNHSTESNDTGKETK